MHKITRLVLLPCHSIWKGGSTLGSERLEWELADFQIEGFDHLCFKNHIIQSLEYIKQDEQSCLIISGGQTKEQCGPVSEAESYLQLGQELVDMNEDLRLRIQLEVFARDSFENVLFLICRFYQVYGYYPETFTVIGFEFKRERFLKLHFETGMGISIDKVEYIGDSPNPVMLSEEEQISYFDDLKRCEYRFGYSPFSQDWYGIQPKLQAKRIARDPFNRTHSYSETNPSLKPFFDYVLQNKSQTQIKNQLKDLPWFEIENR